MRPPASAFTSTPQRPCSMTGALKMRSRSRASARSFLEGPAAAPISRTAAKTMLLERIQRLDDAVERGGVDLCGALVAVAARESVGPLFREGDLLLLALVELHRGGEVGGVESRRLVGEAGGPRIGQRRDERVDLGAVDGLGGGRDLLPGVLVLFERRRLAGARDLEARRVERARVEEILQTQVVGGFLELVGQRRLDG